MLKHINACGKNDELVELKTEATIELIIGDNENSTVGLRDSSSFLRLILLEGIKKVLVKLLRVPEPLQTVSFCLNCELI